MDRTPQLITPQVINEVEFRQKVRGYDPDEVDDFLERMAIAVAELQDRLREATERATRVEGRPADAAAGSVAAVSPPAAASNEMEAIRRTLVLAQRTADAAVDEAQQAAAQTVTAARQEADRLLEDARSSAATIVSDAEAAAARDAEAARGRLVAEIESLEQTLDDLHGDVALIERHLEDQRGQVRGSIAVLQGLLDDPSKLTVADKTDLAPGDAPRHGDGAQSGLASGRMQDATSPFSPFASSAPASVPDETSGASAPERTPPGGGSQSSPGAFDDVAPHTARAAGSGEEPAFATYRTEPSIERAGARATERAGETGTASPWSHVASSDDELGLPTGSFRIDDPNATDDAYLDELRKAMIDPDAPGRPVGTVRERPHDDRFARPHDGPLEARPQQGDGDGGLFDQDDFDDVTRARNRFGRRR